MVGLLAGALGTGIGQAAGSVADMAKGYIDDERKVDLQRQFADIELEKQNRLDEARKAREYEYKVKETDPNGVLVANELKNSSLKARQDAANKVGQVNTPGYLDAKGKEARATHIESSGSIAQAALANFQLASQKEVQDLRTKLANTSDPTERDSIKSKISDLSPNSKGSYADVASVGNGYRLMAKEARADAANVTLSDEERKTATTRAQEYETMADAVFQSITEKRGVGNPPPKTQQPTAPGVQKPSAVPDLSKYKIK